MKAHLCDEVLEAWWRRLFLSGASGAFIFWLLVCLSEDESVENFLLGDCRVSSTGLIVIGSPNAPASVHTLVLFDLRLGFLD